MNNPCSYMSLLEALEILADLEERAADTKEKGALDIAKSLLLSEISREGNSIECYVE